MNTLIKIQTNKALYGVDVNELSAFQFTIYDGAEDPHLLGLIYAIVGKSLDKLISKNKNIFYNQMIIDKIIRNYIVNNEHRFIEESKEFIYDLF